VGSDCGLRERLGAAVADESGSDDHPRGGGGSEECDGDGPDVSDCLGGVGGCCSVGIEESPGS